LIDIMFFLLASFMLVSLSMVNLKSVKVSLPTASSATPDTRHDFVRISVDRSGATFLDRQLVGAHELVQNLAAAHRTNENLRVLVSGDVEARHGDIMRVLDLVRAAGVQHVAFETRSAPEPAPPRP